MGNSCTCIKDANESEVETFNFKGAKLEMIIKIQKTWRGFKARKALRDMKTIKKMGQLNSNQHHYQGQNNAMGGTNHVNPVFQNSGYGGR